MGDSQPRRYRHRGPRRASGGTWTPPEPEDDAPAPPEGEPAARPSGEGRSDAAPGPARTQRPDAGPPNPAAEKDDAAGGKAPLDARARWLMEERPPHWG